MTIIIPMAGLSARFMQAGYTLPKYMLELHNKSIFYHAVQSFQYYFNTHRILFICRNVFDTQAFIHNECKKLDLQNYDIVALEKETLGQAHTVALGIEKAHIDSMESLLIFNIDTFRPHFMLPQTFDINKIDGYLEVLQADGEHWSFVLSNGKDDKVMQTAEKKRISSLCSTGLYYFRLAKDFCFALHSMMQKNQTIKGEYYIAPLYNALIQAGKDIRFFQINPNDVVFCGTPQEYEGLQIL